MKQTDDVRKIKFRGKDVFGNWQYGSLVEIISTSPDTCSVRSIITPEGHEHPCGQIGQFTGLYDYKGNEIYEGDIIRSFSTKGDPIIHIIEYDCDEACFVARLNGSGRYDFGYGGLRKTGFKNFKKK